MMRMGPNDASAVVCRLWFLVFIVLAPPWPPYNVKLLTSILRKLVMKNMCLFSPFVCLMNA